MSKPHSTRLSEPEERAKRSEIVRYTPPWEPEIRRQQEDAMMKNFYNPMNDPYFFEGSERYERRTEVAKRRQPKYTILYPTRFQLAPSSVPRHNALPRRVSRKIRNRTPHAMFVVTYMRAHAVVERSCTVPASSGTCWTEIASGAVWKEQFDYVVNTDNTYGISAVTLKNWVASSFDEWDDRISASNIVGGLSSQTFDGTDSSSPDGKNEITFGPLDDLGVLAVAIVWGFFDGDVSSREIIECDIVLNSNLVQDWGDGDTSSSVHDVRNILTHEIGHCIGGADLYEDEDSELTMYGFASLGETKKRSVEQCEINGANACYDTYG